MSKYSSSESTDSEELAVTEIYDKYIPYWPWFLILIILFLTGAWIYLRYKSPVFETKASILIKDESKGLNPMDPLQAFDLFGTNKIVENEMEVIKSKTLMQEVVENLHLYAPLMVSGRVRTSNAYVYSPIRIEVRQPDSLKFVKEVPFEYNEARGVVMINGQTFPLNSYQKTEYGNLKFTINPDYKKPKNGERADDHYSFSLQSIKSTANSLLGQLTVSQSGNMSTVIDITFKGEVPKQNEDILNELLKVYNKAAILDKNVLAASTLKFLDERLKFVEHDLDSIEGSLQNFRSNNKLTDISAQGNIYLETVAANDKQISDINMQLAVLDQVGNYLTGKGSTGGMVPSTLGLSDPVLTQLLQKMSDLEIQYEQMKKIVPENNPAVVSILDAIDKLKPSIRENIQNQRKNLQAAKGDLTQRSDRYSSILTKIPQKERELLSINRQQIIKNNIYTFLLQKKEETSLSFASAIADSRIIDAAETSGTPVSPKKNLILLGAFLGALILGVAIIYIKDLFTRTVQSRAELEKKVSIPILGEISFDQSKSPIVITEGKRSYIAEQFRQLRTSLAYLGVDETHNKIMITSSISEEGKSFISINLGISLSLTDKKVALLELDLRKPKLSEVFNISRSIGITNYLVGKADLTEIVRPTKVANLFLLPSGPIPPNPSELISNGRMEVLLDALHKRFDYVIIDTAPTAPVTDAFLLSVMANVSLYVVRHNYTPKMFLTKLQKFKEEGRLKNPAVIYNGVRGKGIKKYGYGKEYGYGYTDDVQPWWQSIFKK